MDIDELLDRYIVLIGHIFDAIDSTGEEERGVLYGEGMIRGVFAAAALAVGITGDVSINSLSDAGKDLIRAHVEADIC